MIMTFALYAMSLPAGAVAGKVFAHMNDMDNEEAIAGFSALFPPLGAFCAIYILMKDLK